MTNLKRHGLLLATASMMALATPAFAQNTTPADGVSAAAPADGPVITVTGSRVIKNGDASPSPVTVIPTEDLFKSTPGATLAEALNTLPTFAGSRGATSNPTTVGSAAGGNGGANQLNLRNLDPTRTLVLMDGKRIPPSLFNGVVDVDVIPQMLVQRVDVVTGGVSAVYGSDAVSGVVNYIVDHKFNGFRAEASYGETQYGDGTKLDAGIAFGTNLGDRGHFEASYEYRKEGGIGRRSDRDWLNQVGVTGAGSAASPFVLQTNLRQSGFPFGGLITTGALTGQEFKTNGVLSAFVHGTTTGTSGVEVGGDGGYWDSGLVARLKGHQVFGRFDYELSDDVRFYAQVSGTIKNNSNDAETNQLNGVTLRRSNAFLPAAVQALMPVAQTTFRFSKFLGDAPRVSGDADSDQWVIATGFDGKLGTFRWNLDYTHGISKLDTNLYNAINRQHLAAALDAVVNGSGQTVCNITITNPGLNPGCVPLNPFGPTSDSAAAVDYVTDTINFKSTTTTDNIGGSISGSPFSTWAGEVNTALSAEWRKTSFTSTSSSGPNDLVDCTGLTLNCTVGTQINEFSFGALPNGVSQTVWEVAGEFDAPLLDKSAIGSLNVNGALRYTRYNTSGSYWTWKAGLDWQITDTLRARLTRSRDIRAPTLYDLFSPLTIVPIRPTDLLTGLAPTVPSIDQSNPNLKAEIGNTLTGGLVWKATPHLSFAVDGYKINIKNAITQVAGSTNAIQQACYASGGSSSYCLLQDRPINYTNNTAANAVTAWRTVRFNLAEIDTWGVDFEANYTGSLFSRPLMIRMLAAWQPHLRNIQAGLPTIDQGGVGFGVNGMGATPAWRVSGFIRFQPLEKVTIDLTERFRSAMKLGGDPTQVWVDNHMNAFATTGINVAWDVDLGSASAQLFANVQNVFNATPPIGAYSGNGTRAGLRDGFAIGDDPRGRFFTGGFKLKF
jgi:outer membrane receptor protein involved in Fe transport